MPTVNIPISAGSDDGSFGATGSAFDAASSILRVGDNRGTFESLFLRFTGVGIPSGVQIDSASVTLVSEQAFSDPLTLTIQAAKQTNPSAPTSAADAQGRTRTTASTNWVLGSWGSNTNEVSPGFASVVQELVNQPGWASGNPILLFLDATSGSGVRDAYAYGHATGGPAVLSVSYTVLNQAPEITSGPTVSYGPYGKVSPNENAGLSFTATDADTGDQGAAALSWEVRTAAAGAGNLVTSGTCTHNIQEQLSITAAQLETAGVPEDTDTTLYLRVSDGNAADEQSFQIRAVYAHDTDILTGESVLLAVTSGTLETHLLLLSGETILLSATDGDQTVTLRGAESVLLVGTDGTHTVTLLSGETLLLALTSGEVEGAGQILSGESVLRAITSGEHTAELYALTGESVVLTETSGFAKIAVYVLEGESILLAEASGERDVQMRSGESVLLAETSGTIGFALYILSGESILFLVTSGEATIPLVRHPALVLSYLSVVDATEATLRVI